MAAARCLALALVLGALGCGEQAPSATGKLWPEADGLFHRDARFVGGDGAYSVALGGDRVLWLFGDSFIARGEPRVRANSKMVRNCVALQTGLDPSNAFLQFYWPESDGEPQSFVAEDGARWFWPMHGIRTGESLLLFFERLNTPTGDPEGFESNAWTAFVVDDPDAAPSSWSLHVAQLPSASHDVLLGEAVLRVGSYVYLYGTRGTRHSIFVARLSAERVEAGDLSKPSWWTGADWSTSGPPVPVVGIGAPEFSVHYDVHVGRYLMVYTEGYGSTTLALRAADRPEGPWTAPRDIIRPPESSEPDAFVYAGKAHPELSGAQLVATYVPSSFEDVPVADEDRLYFPHFVRVSF